MRNQELQRTRRSRWAIVFLLASLLTLAVPPVLQAVAVCNQYPGTDGSCTTWCDFYGPGGQYQGYVRYDWCN